MQFKDLEACPFCGCDEFYEKQQARGTINYRMRFDGKETDNSAMYDGLITLYSGRVYCNDCSRYLGNYLKNIVSKLAEKQLCYNSTKMKE